MYDPGEAELEYPGEIAGQEEGYIGTISVRKIQATCPLI